VSFELIDIETSNTLASYHEKDIKTARKDLLAYKDEKVAQVHFGPNGHDLEDPMFAKDFEE
jgi:Icc-related predicted phosphoesterase